MNCRKSIQVQFSKNFWRLTSAVLTTSILLSVQCASKPKWTRSGQVMVPPVELSGEITQITRKGDNLSPAFSLDGKKIIFVSRNRPQHAYGQIYEADLDSQKEQRLTFQGAENASPQYVRDGTWILYSSATDETKESPKRIRDSLKETKSQTDFSGPAFLSGPMDLYLHNLQSFNIIRLTSTPGFDGRGFFQAKNENIVFTKERKNQVFLFSVSPKRPQIVKPFLPAPNSSDWVQSQDGSHEAWVEWNSNFSESQLRLKSEGQTVNLLADFQRIKKDPFFVPGSSTILFAMNHPSEKSFNVFSVEADGSCLTQWTNNEHINEGPKVSPDLKSLAFSSNRSGSFQIYLKVWPQTPPCRTP